MEEIIQSSVGSFIFSGLLFFIQLYFRTLLSELKNDIEKTEKNITKIFERLDEVTALRIKAKAAEKSIDGIKRDIERIEDKCDRTHN